MTARIQVTGAQKVARKLKHVPGAVELKLRETLFKAATEVKDAALAEINAPKHGRLYTRNRPNKGRIVWRASAPGEAPAKKTGERMKGIKVRKSNRKLRPQTRVIAPAIYRLLARGLGKIAPRPLFGPLTKKMLPAVHESVRKATAAIVKRTMRRG